MSSVDPLYAQWLQTDALWLTRFDPMMKGSWGDSAVVAERATGIALLPDAEQEADRQLQFLSRGPFAVDVHQLPIADGWRHHLGRVVTLTIDQLGYDAGIDVFVIEVEDNQATGMSAVAVLRPLREPQP